MDDRKRLRNDDTSQYHFESFKRYRRHFHDCDPAITSRDNDRTPSPASVAEAEMLEDPVVVVTPWWKEQQQHQRAVSKDQQIHCYICEGSIRSTDADANKNPPIQEAVQSNTLLAYFRCSNATKNNNNNNKALLPKAVSTATLPNCNYCGRTNVCQDCFAPCDACGQLFCAFCRTNEYYGTVAQCLCVDCGKEHQISHDIVDVNAMDIG